MGLGVDKGKGRRTQIVLGTIMGNMEVIKIAKESCTNREHGGKMEL